MGGSPHHHLGPGARLLALLCSALLACTTVRTHVSAIAPEAVLQDGHATVQLELWIESNRPLTPEEELRYRADARRALEEALAGRSLEGSGSLVVRSMGVSRTSGRRGDQTAAGIGMAVGAVVIVAGVIVLIVTSKGGGGGGGKSPSAKAPRSVGFSGAHAPRVAAPRGSVPRVSAPRPPRFATVPRGSHPRVRAPATAFIPKIPHGPAVDVGLGVQWAVPVGPPPEPLPPLSPPPAAPAPWSEEGATPPERSAQVEAAPPPPAQASVALAPPEPLPVEDRGFFDGDRLVLDAVMVDPANGEVLWSKRVARKADPRDAKAVRAAVDELLSDGGWTSAAPPGS